MISVPRVSFGAKYVVLRNLANPKDKTFDTLASLVISDHNNRALVCTPPADHKGANHPAQWLLLNPSEAASFKAQIQSGVNPNTAKKAFGTHLDTIQINYRVEKAPRGSRSSGLVLTTNLDSLQI